jgi:threonine/homoserine/homoserine lactone efflux protein
VVTALESVCTGQMYVPTMVMVIKSAGGFPAAAGLSVKAWQYLLLYNVMFVVPLVIVFLLTYFGLRTQTLLDWSKRNVVFSKLLLGIFFLLMAVLMAVM